ncbi:hypothetical protein GEMRC1_006850 [Eukaryota sp. GEM-RC1]
MNRNLLGLHHAGLTRTTLDASLLQSIQTQQPSSGSESDADLISTSPTVLNLPHTLISLMLYHTVVRRCVQASSKMSPFPSSAIPYVLSSTKSLVRTVYPWLSVSRRFQNIVKSTISHLFSHQTISLHFKQISIWEDLSMVFESCPQSIALWGLRGLQSFSCWPYRNTGIVALECLSRSFQFLNPSSDLFMPNLQCLKLSLSKNPWHFPTALRNNTSVTHLDLSWCPMDLTHAESLAKTMCRNSTLIDLNISKCNLRGPSLHCVLHSLSVNKTVQRLNLSGSGFDEESSTLLARVLRHQSNLVDLDLSSCFISSVLISPLAEALAYNSSLLKLNICSNSLGNEGVMFLADAMTVNSTLSWLSLTNCKIESEGGRVLADSLVVNCGLTFVDLWANSLPVSTQEVMKATFQDNSRINVKF